ncbi:MAG: histidine phosphatase family protein [bacterium]|nr:histidine phosphatase family protein [bacterium]
MTDIFIARHGETESNRAGLWQGATDSAMTEVGQEQIRRLGARLGQRSFDFVVSSDLGRAQTTAAATGLAFETSAGWREPDLGKWEGKTYEEVYAMSPEALAGFIRGEDVRLGGADRLSETAERLIAAYRQVVDSVGPDGSALVVTHGLAIAVLTGVLLSTRLPNPLALAGNTGVLRLSSEDGKDRLHVHNDTTHLVDPPISFRGGTEIVFIRHGQTQGNIEQRWQGQQDGALSDLGREQAKGAVAGLPELDVLYTSNLGRAIETGEIIGSGLGLTPQVAEGVEEFSFGDWEGMTHEEIRAGYPDEAHQLFELGEDIVRGRTGETWARLRARVSAAAHTLAERHRGERVGVVSHGGATRAFANEVLAQDFASRGGIVSMRNTAFATFGVTPKQVRIFDWNIAPHLDR